MATQVDRKLCAILAADVVGYSELMHWDEDATIQALKECRRLTDSIIETSGGRIITTAGDSVIAEFAAAGSCVLCARDIQAAIAARNEAPHSGPEMRFRIGLNVGDVAIDGTNLLGEGVNIAARLEALADPDGVLISGSIYDHISADPGVVRQLTIEPLGTKSLKNIKEPVRVFRLLLHGEAAEPAATVVGKGAAAAPRPAVQAQALQLELPGGAAIVRIGDAMAIGREIVPGTAEIAVSYRPVSRLGKQAGLSSRNGRFWVTDLGSANGTFVDDVLLLSREPHGLDPDRGTCVISVGGTRKPPTKGACRFVVQHIPGGDPTLRLKLTRSGLEEYGSAQVGAAWPHLEADLGRVWVFGVGGVRIGAGDDCAVRLAGAAPGGDGAELTRVGGSYRLAPAGSARPLLNGVSISEPAALSSGDVIKLNGQEINVLLLEPS